MTITLPFPPSLHALFSQTRSGRRFISPRYRSWRKLAEQQIQLQRVRPFVGLVDIEIALRAPDKRVRDADNYAKAVIDLLVRMGVIEKDDHNYVRSTTPIWVKDGGTPGVTVTITKATKEKRC
jgi:Holliday junction resolvase RusA-like endonuclease